MDVAGQADKNIEMGYKNSKALTGGMEASKQARHKLIQ